MEYYDQNPCMQYEYEKKDLRGSVLVLPSRDLALRPQEDDHGVKIEAKYLVGEYDILILSAKESSGLKTWLDENGYKIPAGADEVLRAIY